MKRVLMSLLFVMALSSYSYAESFVWDGNKHTYKFMAGAYTWHEARAKAELEGGYLATVTSAAENNFLLDKFYTGNGSNFAWIGGYQYDKFEEPYGHYRWVTAEPWSYTNWGGIEPNNHNSAIEDYVMYNIGARFAGIHPGQWADAIPAPHPGDPVVGYFAEYDSTVAIEPASMILFGLGGISMAFIRRRKAVRDGSKNNH